MVNKVEQYEICIIPLFGYLCFVLFLFLGTYALSMDWVDFFFAGWNGTKFVSFTTGF